MTKRILLKSDGRMTIPQEIREEVKIQEGSLLELEVYGKDKDKILMTVLRR